MSRGHISSIVTLGESFMSALVTPSPSRICFSKQQRRAIFATGHKIRCRRDRLPVEQVFKGIRFLVCPNCNSKAIKPLTEDERKASEMIMHWSWCSQKLAPQYIYLAGKRRCISCQECKRKVTVDPFSDFKLDTDFSSTD